MYCLPYLLFHEFGHKYSCHAFGTREHDGGGILLPWSLTVNVRVPSPYVNHGAALVVNCERSPGLLAALDVSPVVEINTHANQFRSQIKLTGTVKVRYYDCSIVREVCYQ